MLHPFRFIVGYKILKIKAEDSAAFVNMCGDYGLRYISLDFAEESSEIKATLFWSGKILRAAKALGIEIECVRECGLPALIKRYRHRYGIALGALVGLVFAVYTSGLVWDIRVEGNSRLSESEVIGILKTCGFNEGIGHRGLNTGVIENRVLIYSDDISWITINIIGTVAEVEIRETAVVDESEFMAAANLVAERAGVVEYFEQTRGNVAVVTGEAVSEGQLLVGGVYGSEEEGFRYTVAKGKVYASTERDISVEIPLKYEKKVYTGESKTEKYLIFFENEIKFYGNSGNLYASCDTIDTVEYFHSVGGRELPFGIRTVRLFEYEYVTAERSIDEAADLAHYTLKCRTEEELRDAELLSKIISFEITDDSYILTCHMRVIENIARVSEIEIDMLPTKKES